MWCSFFFLLLLSMASTSSNKEFLTFSFEIVYFTWVKWKKNFLFRILWFHSTEHYRQFQSHVNRYIESYTKIGYSVLRSKRKFNLKEDIHCTANEVFSLFFFLQWFEFIIYVNRCGWSRERGCNLKWIYFFVGFIFNSC